MGNINSSLVSDLQAKSLAEKVTTLVSGKDLNYQGVDISSDKINFELSGNKAHANRVLLWLASKPYDFVREDTNAGILYSILGRIGTDNSNMEKWENFLKNNFAEKFASDLTLSYLNLRFDSTSKLLKIDMIVTDALNKTTFSISTGASV